MKQIQWLTLLAVCLLLIPACTRTPAVPEPGSDSGTAAATGTETEPETEKPVKEKTTMNVMSFNVLGMNRETQTAKEPYKTVDATVETRGVKLNRLLVGEQIDIAGFQELTAPWRIWFREKLDSAYGFVGTPTRDTGEGGYIAYRKDKYEPVEKGVFWLYDGAPSKPAKYDESMFDRMCYWALFRVKASGEYFLFMDTHLDHTGATAKQAKVIVDQIPVISEKMKTAYGIKSLPVMLVGDMNSRPDTEAYRVLTSALRDARLYSKGDTVDGRYATSPDLRWVESEADYRQDGHVIDYLMISRQITVNNYKMVWTSTNLCPYGEFISDHNAVIVNVGI